jgi:hypothetical protein
MHYYSYAIQCDSNIKFFYNNSKTEYYQITNETIFDIRLLNNLMIDIVFKQCSFKGFTTAYNYLYSTRIDKRYRLCPKRLTETFFTFHANKFFEEFFKEPMKSIHF